MTQHVCFFNKKKIIKHIKWLEMRQAQKITIIQSSKAFFLLEIVGPSGKKNAQMGFGKIYKKHLIKSSI